MQSSEWQVTLLLRNQQKKSQNKGLSKDFYHLYEDVIQCKCTAADKINDIQSQVVKAAVMSK